MDLKGTDDSKYSISLYDCVNPTPSKAKIHWNRPNHELALKYMDSSDTLLFDILIKQRDSR